MPGPEASPSPQDPPAGQEQGYDSLVQQVIPGYASLARLGVALLAASPLASRQGADVLVAGCGTGAELLEARAQRPDWRLTALDPSPGMLAVARSRLTDAPGIDWRCARLEEIGAQACFDGALAVLVLQALPDDGSKLTFLSALAGALRPGAQVVLVDLMRPERSPLEGQLARAREGFQRASGFAPGGAGPGGERVDGLTRGLHPIGLARLTALLEAAGFGDPAPVFQALDFEGFLLQRRA
ncbi:MAG: class I SAM-dependent methyltransferase [Synechococcaceae cyanobacterium]|nr:class I SAM-dependent methyltransferase [Synechococcaceae cyanobacterium]